MLKVKGQGHILVQMCGGNRHACWQWGIVKVPLIFLPWTVILSSTWTRWIGLRRCPMVWTFSKPQNVMFCFVFLMQVTTAKRRWMVVIQIHAFTVNVSTRWADGYLCVCRPPYSGLNSSVLLDLYMPDQCRNGAARVPDATYSTFSCQCSTGYTGHCCCPHHNLALFDDKCVV